MLTVPTASRLHQIPKPRFQMLIPERAYTVAFLKEFLWHWGLGSGVWLSRGTPWFQLRLILLAEIAKFSAGGDMKVAIHTAKLASPEKSANIYK